MTVTRFRLVSFLVVAFVLASGSAQAGDVGKWQRFEVSFPNAAWQGNPYDIDLVGTFTSPSGRTLEQFGFYAGDDTWKIYFMPDEIGQWSYTTSSRTRTVDGVDLQGDSDLDGHGGSFDCVSSSLIGSLRAENKRWVHGDNGAIAPLALVTRKWFRAEETEGCDHSSGRCPGELIDWAKNEAGATLIAQIFGSFCLDTGRPFITDNPGSTSGDMVGMDFQVWDNMNSHFDRMRDLDLGHYVMLYADGCSTPDNHDIGPKSVWEMRIFRYLIARFAPYPMVVWDSGIDIGEYRSDSWIDWFATWFLENDPWQHPVDSRSGGGSGGKHADDGTYFSAGAVFGASSTEHDAFVSDWHTRDVPTFFTDRWGTGSDSSGCSRGGSRPEARTALWEMALTGGTSAIVGACSGPSRYLSDNFRNELHMAPDLHHMANFLRNDLVEFGELDPHDELVTSGQSAVNALAANLGSEYLAYLDGGGTFGIDLSAAQTDLQVDWFNPRDGTTTSDGVRSAPHTASETFTAPSSKDWTLHIYIGGPDLTPPTLVDVRSVADPGTVTVVFSERVDSASAENTSNYSLAPAVGIATATLGENQTTVTLTTATPLTPNTSYTLTVNGVKDQADPPNTIAANTTFSFEYSDTAAFEWRIESSADDAEERSEVNLTSTDLDLGEVASGPHTVGMRFVGVDIPRGTLITEAWVQFTADDDDSESTSLTIQAEASDDAEPFGSFVSRPRAGLIAWSPTGWSNGQAGPNQRTPNLAPLIQLVIDRPGWSAGNALALYIAGSGKRTATSYDGDPTLAPRLHIEFTTSIADDPPPPPVVIGAD